MQISLCLLCILYSHIHQKINTIYLNLIFRLFIEDQDWKTALKIVQPSAKREGFVTVPDVTWADVGALELVREELQLAILAPVNHKQQFDSLGLPQSSGILLTLIPSTPRVTK